jgi:small subunit ribosomal protein S20
MSSAPKSHDFRSILAFRSEIRYTQPFKGGDFVPHIPFIKSSKKDVHRSRKNHLRNIAAKSAMKTFIKKARLAIEAPEADATAAAEALRLACKAIDKTAERKIIHKNQASRRKSRLMKRANKAAAQQTA